MDRGSKFYAPTGETTEWEDILIKKGIIAPKTKVEEEIIEDQNEEVQVEDLTMDELDELEDDYDDDRELARIRAKRIEEMKLQAQKNKFGEIYPISKDQWTKEVTEGSKESCVIAYLFDRSLESCKLVDQILPIIAKRHRNVKFVSIQAQACIENWPQRNLPTLFVYRNGDLQNQLFSLSKLGGLNMKVEDLEEHLAELGAFGVED